MIGCPLGCHSSSGCVSAHWICCRSVPVRGSAAPRELRRVDQTGSARPRQAGILRGSGSSSACLEQLHLAPSPAHAGVILSSTAVRCHLSHLAPPLLTAPPGRGANGAEQAASWSIGEYVALCATGRPPCSSSSLPQSRRGVGNLHRPGQLPRASCRTLSSRPYSAPAR